MNQSPETEGEEQQPARPSRPIPHDETAMKPHSPRILPNKSSSNFADQIQQSHHRRVQSNACFQDGYLTFENQENKTPFQGQGGKATVMPATVPFRERHGTIATNTLVTISSSNTLKPSTQFANLMLRKPKDSKLAPRNMNQNQSSGASLRTISTPKSQKARLQRNSTQSVVLGP